MFEIIGIVVALLVVWKLLKATLSGATKGHMLRSVDHATTLGVPYEFALRMIQHRDVIKASVAHMAKLKPDFRLKDVYVQYGEAIAMMYQGYLSEQEKGK